MKNDALFKIVFGDVLTEVIEIVQPFIVLQLELNREAERERA
jgi:hypothetical protein